MALTVEAAFNGFYDNINLTGNHREAATLRKDDIVDTLKKSFHVLDAFATGSIPKYTALRTVADLDVIVVLHYGKHVKGKSPSEVLGDVRKALAEYRTNVRKNGQAVTLHYKTWPNVDIVPVCRVPNDDGTVNHYEVPNANSESWIDARPRKFANEIEQRSKVCGHNFRRIIKIIKQWNLAHSEYLSSYHIEVLALNIFTENLDDTSWQVLQFFDKARALVGSFLWHELGFADANLSYADRTEAIKRLETATEKSRLAWYLTFGDNHDHKRAITLLKEVFGDNFPSYG